MNELTIRKPDDFHVHLRQGPMLRAVLPYTARQFARALVMPNLSPPLVDPVQIASYRDEIRSIAPGFEPLMTFYANDSVSPESVPFLKAAGAIAGKLYPQGVTTGSEAGVADIQRLYPLFAAMQEQDLVLCIHGETPGCFVLYRETDFVDNELVPILENFPRLRVVLEHVTTAYALGVIRMLRQRFRGRIAATITVHHLYLTLDDILGGKLNPHAFCMPVAKTRHDREALIHAATSGEPAFFLGTDSAPHLRSQKECRAGCAGIFTAPCAMESLLEVFEAANALDKIQNFTSGFGAEFYGLPHNTETVTFVKEPYAMPHGIDVPAPPPKMNPMDVSPFRAGEVISWYQQPQALEE